jgi:inorganic pyrophosphatase
MDLSQIPVGVEPPWDIHAVIEIPQGGIPVKYELEKKSGALYVDRFLHTSMYYPGNYGFVPQTLAEDGDPCDIVVVGQVPVVPGAVIRCRPIGALIMRDEAGGDEKIVAVPVDKLHPFYSGVRSYKDLPPILIDQIAHFFQHYKDLEKGKWVTIVKWEGPEGAARLIREGISRVQGVKVPTRTHRPASAAASKKKTAARKKTAKARKKSAPPTSG